MRQRGGALKRGEGAGSKPAKKAASKHLAAKKVAAKKAAHGPAKKVAKHAAKKAAKQVSEGQGERALRVRDDGDLLVAAFHSLNRAGAVISLLEQSSGGDLRRLLEVGVAGYGAAVERGTGRAVARAFGLLRGAEHLGMAGLYAARIDHATEVETVEGREAEQRLRSLSKRLAALPEGSAENERLRAMAMELARRAEGADHDRHLRYELTMAAHHLCAALEAKAD